MNSLPIARLFLEVRALEFAFSYLRVFHPSRDLHYTNAYSQFSFLFPNEFSHETAFYSINLLQKQIASLFGDFKLNIQIPLFLNYIAIKISQHSN